MVKFNCSKKLINGGEEMRKRILSLVVACVMVVGCLTGCGDSQTTSGTSSKKSEIDVGVVLPTKDEPRWLQDQTQFETILADAGFTYQVLFSQGSSATEKTNVETLIS